MKLIAFAIVIAALWFGWPHFFPSEPVQQASAPPYTEKMAGAEEAYYQQVFDYAMETVAPGKNYVWESYSVSGKFTVEKSFVSKSKARCKKYLEEFTVTGGETTNLEGVACKREGRDGWCRLNKGDAQTCAMEKTTGTDSVIRGAEDAVESGKDVLGKAKGLFNR